MSPTLVQQPFTEQAPPADSFKHSASLQLQSLSELQHEQVYARDYSYLSSDSLPSGGMGGGGGPRGNAQQRRGRPGKQRAGHHSKRTSSPNRDNKQKRSK